MMKKISGIIGFLVILLLIISLVTYSIGELPNAQTTNSSMYNKTQNVSDFWFSLSSVTTILVILGVMAVLFALILYFKTIF